MSDVSSAILILSVTDQTGRPSPFKAEWWSDDGPVKRLWSNDGSAQVRVDAGPLSVLVRRGIHYDAVKLELLLRTGESREEVVLRQRFDPKAMGFHGGESHMHVLHGRNDPPRTIADGGTMGAGDGLDYLQLCAAWDDSFDWPTADELEARCRAATNEHVVVGWNLETPKCYMGVDDGGRSGNLHCYGHGWTVGLKDISAGRDFFKRGPNFRIMQEIRRQGGIVGCAHPLRATFGHGGNFISNWASELPFDYVAGAGYEAVDILNDSPLLFFQSERLWWTLLNLGYKVAGTGNSDGALGTCRAVGRYRTYTRIDGDFSWDALAENMAAGRNVATSGPFVLFQIDAQDPGAELPADGRPHAAGIQAWSGPLPEEYLYAVQLIRNGEIVKSWDLHGQKLRQWSTELDIGDDDFAWYCVRVLADCRDPVDTRLWGPVLYDLAVANPFYFLPAGFRRPEPANATVSLRVAGPDGKPTAATVTTVDAGMDIGREAVDTTGRLTLTVPATAWLLVSAAGCAPAERCIYLDCPEIYDYCLNMNTQDPSFYSPQTYRALRERLADLQMTVRLTRED